MKRLWITLTLAVGFVVAAVVPLEAGVEYRARTWQEGKQKNRQLETTIKASVDGDKAKIVFEDSGNPSMPAGSYLLTTDGGQTLYLVKPQDKTYGEFDLEAVMQMLDAFSESGMVDIQIDNPQLVKLAAGPGKSVAGMDAKHARYGMSYEMQLKVIGIKKAQTIETVQDIWYTDEVSDAGLRVWSGKSLPKTGTDLDELIALEASKIEGFPLETVETMTTTSKKGKQTTTTTHMLVSDLRRGVSFPAGTWLIPDDYTPVQMMPTGEMAAGGQQEPPAEGEQEETKGGMLGRLKKFGKKKG